MGRLRSYRHVIDGLNVEESLFLTKEELQCNDLKRCQNAVSNVCMRIRKKSGDTKEFTAIRTQLKTTTYGILVKRIK